MIWLQVLIALYAAGATAEKLSPLLAAPFSCDRCSSVSSFIPGSTTWCLCCFYNCGGRREACYSEGSYCGSPARCQRLDICDTYGGVPPAGALPGVASSFFESDGVTLKQSSVSRPPSVDRHSSNYDPDADRDSARPNIKGCPRGYEPALLDFEEVSEGNVAGRVQAVFGEDVAGVTISSACFSGSDSTSLNRLVVFDTEDSGSDFPEWRSPNFLCLTGGHGIGIGGSPISKYANCDPLGKILVVQASNGSQCAKETTVTITFLEPLYVSYATVINAQRNVSVIVPSFRGLDSADVQLYDESFDRPKLGWANGVSELRVQHDDIVKKVAFHFSEPLGIVALGLCAKVNNTPVACSNSLMCPTNVEDQCVRDRCSKLDWTNGGRGRGRCQNHQQYPCKSNRDGPCVCKLNPSVQCVPRTPAPPSPKPTPKPTPTTVASTTATSTATSTATTTATTATSTTVPTTLVPTPKPTTTATTTLQTSTTTPAPTTVPILGCCTRINTGNFSFVSCTSNSTADQCASGGAILAIFNPVLPNCCDVLGCIAISTPPCTIGTTTGTTTITTSTAPVPTTKTSTSTTTIATTTPVPTTKTSTSTMVATTTTGTTTATTTATTSTTATTTSPGPTPAPIVCCTNNQCSTSLTSLQCTNGGGVVLDGFTQCVPGLCQSGCCRVHEPFLPNNTVSCRASNFSSCTNQPDRTFVNETCCGLPQCQSVPVTPPCPDCDAHNHCGERPGCHGGLLDGFECRDIHDCFGGYKCVPAQKACCDDAPCQDCNGGDSDVDQDTDDLRAHQCGVCRFCSAEEKREQEEEDERHESGELWRNKNAEWRKKHKHENETEPKNPIPCCPYDEDIRLQAKATSGDAAFELLPPQAYVRGPAKANAFVRITVAGDFSRVCIKFEVAQFAIDGFIVFKRDLTPLASGATTSATYFECFNPADFNISQSLYENLVVNPTDHFVHFFKNGVNNSATLTINGFLDFVSETNIIKTNAKKSCKDGDNYVSGASCRQRLGCTCFNCVDRCDHKFFGNDVKLPSDIVGVAPDNRLAAQAAFDFSILLFPGQLVSIDDDFCRTAFKKSCGLAAGEWRYATLDAHRVFNTTSFAIGRPNFDTVHYDTYRIYAAQRLIKVTLHRAVDVQTAKKTFELIYLIDANKWCNDAAAFRAETITMVQKSANLREVTATIRVPRPGHYILVVSAGESNSVDGVDVTDDERAKLRCIDYKVQFEAEQPKCPTAEICDLVPCRGARDCPDEDCDEYSCATDFGRCILHRPLYNPEERRERAERQWLDVIDNRDWDDDDDNTLVNDDDSDYFYSAKSNELPEKQHKKSKGPKKYSVCKGKANDTACIIVQTNAPSSLTVPRLCHTGVCSSGECVLNLNSIDFDCDCSCPRACESYIDCNDGNATTIDLCDQENGVCVHRPRQVIAPPPFVPLECPLFNSTLPETQQNITRNCTDNAVVAGQCVQSADPRDSSFRCQTTLRKSDSLKNETFECAVATPCASAASLCNCTLSFQVCERSLNASSSNATLRCVDSDDVILATFNAAAKEHSVVALSTEPIVSADVVLAALDRAEIAYTAAAFDVFGDSTTQRGPLCSSDVEERQVTIDSTIQIDSSCAAIDVAAECLDGAVSAADSGHRWFDRAWRSLDSAARAAQANRQSRAALAHACCAQLYYNGLGAWCGRRGADVDFWGLAGASLQSKSVGAECVAFDDGHRDRDLNDWVAEQRLVEVRVGKQLRAINIHVVPLARGGGYRSSYAISLRGADVSSIRNGASAACSERARAVLPAAFDAQALRSYLLQRQEFGDGTRVAVFHHVLAAAGAEEHSLPLGVRESFCATLGSSSGATPYCPAQSDGDVPLFDNTQTALPSDDAGVNAAFEEIIGATHNIDRSVNTRRNTLRQTPLYAASAVIIPTSTSSDSSALRFVLRNDDCGAAVVLGGQLVDGLPLAVSVPADACASWRWAAEGVALVADRASEESTCVGGSEGGIAVCSAGTEALAVCTSSGGECAAAPAEAGVPYGFAKLYFDCLVCGAGDSAQCGKAECADPRVARWFENGTPALLYRPARPLRAAVLNGAADD